MHSMEMTILHFTCNLGARGEKWANIERICQS